MGKGCLHFFSAVLDPILFILAGNDNIHESLDEFEIWLDLTTGFHGNMVAIVSLWATCFDILDIANAISQKVLVLEARNF